MKHLDRATSCWLLAEVNCRGQCGLSRPLSAGFLSIWQPSSLPSPDDETAPAELPAGDIQCRTQLAIVDLEKLSLLYLSEESTFHYCRLFYHGNNVTCRYLRSKPQRHAPSGHHVGHGLKKMTVYRTVVRINREEPGHHKRGRHDVLRAQFTEASILLSLLTCHCGQIPGC